MIAPYAWSVCKTSDKVLNESEVSDWSRISVLSRWSRYICRAGKGYGDMGRPPSQYLHMAREMWCDQKGGVGSAGLARKRLNPLIAHRDDGTARQFSRATIDAMFAFLRLFGLERVSIPRLRLMLAACHHAKIRPIRSTAWCRDDDNQAHLRFRLWQLLWTLS
jgi:hypothetical protein